MSTMSMDHDEIAKKCWQTGSKAFNAENWDYAVEMFMKSVQFRPDNLAYRQSLRGAEYRKYNQNKKGAGMMAKTKLMGIRGKVSKHKGKGEWDAVDHACEEGLYLNPWDPQLNADAAESCMRRGYEEVGKFLMEAAVQADPDSIKFNTLLANLLEEKGEYKNAAAIWRRIQKLDPQAFEARTKIMHLESMRTIDDGGYEIATSTKDVAHLPDHEVARRLGRNQKKTDEVDGPGQSEEHDILNAIRKDPNNKDLYLKLGDFYRRLDRFDDAIEYYTKADEKAGGNVNIKEFIEDMQLAKLGAEVKSFKNEAIQNPKDEELTAFANKKAEELLDREISVYSTRVKRYPADMRLKFELARRYRHKAMWAEAIPLLQAASNDQRLEVEALVALGKCFIQDNRPPMALRQFKKALPNLRHDDKPEVFKEVHYYVGRIEEKAGNKSAAEDSYSEILAHDYNYKDVRARLERLQGGGG
jgi:tetratricopeptide (TPR) repeat protein